MKKNEKSLEYQAKLPRTGHDLSHTFTYTSAPGMILPVLQDFLYPSETINVNMAQYSRVLNFLTDAMIDVEQKIDLFFVPMSMLFTAAPNFITGFNDVISSNFLEDDATPRSNSLLFPGQLNADDFASIFFRQPDDTVETYGYKFGNAFVQHWQERADSLKLPFSWLPFDGAEISSGTGPADDFLQINGFESPRQSVMRLLMMCNMNSMAVFRDAQTQLSNTWYAPELPYVTPWALLTYQCIYQNWYRNDDYEKRFINAYNIDAFFGDEDWHDHPLSFLNLICLRYKDRKKDYFSEITPSPLTSSINQFLTDNNYAYGDVNTDSIANVVNSVNSFLGENTYTLSDQIGSTSPSHNTNMLSGDPTPTQLMYDGNGFSTSNLRVAFAMEKLLRIIGKAPKDYDSQILAQFGYKVPHDVKHDISFLGSWSGNLKVNEVVSTAETQDASSGARLGQIAGNGTGHLAGNKIKFTAPCHGFLMAVSYATVDQSYLVGITTDKGMLIRSVNDMFIPAYDKLGKQPVFVGEVFPRYLLGSGSDAAFFGWQNRYNQWKRKFDRHTLAFSHPRLNNTYNMYEAWIVGRNTPYKAAFDGQSVPPYNVTRVRFNYLNFKQSPHDLDSVLSVPYNDGWNQYSSPDTPWLPFQTDPFINKLSIEYYKVSVMSKTGEPAMDDFLG